MNKTAESIIESTFFSVVMPVFNEERYLKVAIESVLEQSHQKWELVIIDDGSTDSTKSICKEFSDNRIQYQYQDNKGLSAARNIGVSLSKGRYVCFLDGDDFWLPDHLNILNKAILKRGSPKATFRAEWIRLYGNKQKQIVEDQSKIMRNPAKYFLIYTPVMHTLCFHKAIFKKCLFVEELFSWEDRHFIARVTSLYPFYQVKGFFAVYRRDSKNTQMDFMEAFYTKYKHEIECIDDLTNNYQEEIKNYISKKDIMHAKFETTMNFGHIALNNNDFKKSMFTLREGSRQFMSFVSLLRLINLGCKTVIKYLLRK